MRRAGYGLSLTAFEDVTIHPKTSVANSAVVPLGLAFFIVSLADKICEICIDHIGI